MDNGQPERAAGTEAGGRHGNENGEEWGTGTGSAEDAGPRRQSKSGISDPDQLLDLWEDRIVAELGSGLRPAAERIALVVEAGPAARTRHFSPTAVAAEAIQAVAETRAAWSRADLMLEVERRLLLSPPAIGAPGVRRCVGRHGRLNQGVVGLPAPDPPLLSNSDGGQLLIG